MNEDSPTHMVLVLLNGHHPRLKFFDIFASNNGHLRASWNRDFKGGYRLNKNKLMNLQCELFDQTLWQINNHYLLLRKRWMPGSDTQSNICKHPSCRPFSQPKVNVLPQTSNNVKCKSNEEITVFQCALLCGQSRIKRCVDVGVFACNVMHLFLQILTSWHLDYDM